MLLKKTCTKCGLELEVEDFYLSKLGKHGRQSRCIECHKAQRAISPEALERKKEFSRKWHGTIRGRYQMLLTRSKKRKQVQNLLCFDDYARLVDGALCIYCGESLPKRGVGLDRIDNNEGYVAGNVVPCCGDCNTTRSDVWSHEEMLLLSETIKKLKANRRAA